MTIATWGDLLVKKEYKMTKPILQNRDYTLSVAGTMGRNSVVAMLGNDMVIGRLKNNTITFRITDFTEEDTIVLICPEGGSITHAQLERGNKATDWTPAPEDAQEYTENKVAEAKKYVDDLEIGGRNYFSLTHLNSISPSSWAVDNAYVYNFTLEPNTKYILSSNVPTDGDSSKNVLYFNGSGTSSNGAWSNNPRIMETDSNGKLFIAIPTGRTHTNGILNGTYWVQLEKGTKATDWTPAPEDVQAEIDSRPTFQDFDQTDKVTINGGNIKAGTISSENSYSWIDLDKGHFSFGNKRLVWNGSEMTVNGKISVNNIDGDIPKSKLAGAVQTELNAGSTANTTVSQNKTKWDTGASNASTALTRTTIHDRRSDNRPPSWYLSNYPRQVVQEFKSVSTMGVGQGVETYGILTTTIQYDDATGGRIKQEFKVGKNIYTRSGSGASWDSWTDPIGRTEAWSYNGTTEIDGKSIRTGTLEANKITTGTLKSQNNNSWINLNNGEFNFAKGGLVYSGGNLTLNGKLSVTNLNGKLTDSQIGSAGTWNAKETTSGALAKANTAEANAKELASAMAFGKMLYTDPTFKYGVNDVKAYNNSSGSPVTISRITTQQNAPTDSTHIIRVSTTTGATTPGLGGFFFGTMTSANKTYITRFIAKIPSGRSLAFATNATGSGGNHTSKWLSSNQGTGRWEEYVYKVTAGDTGTFSTTNFFYISGGSKPLTWYIAYATVFDVTDDDLIAHKTDAWSYNGTTEIDGKSIKTGTLTANKITSGTLDASKITVKNLDANSITSNKISFVNSAWNSINSRADMNATRLKFTHSDGSSTEIGSSGIRRVTPNESLSYHYLISIHTFVYGDSSNNARWIQLPNDFKGKNFKVYMALADSMNVANYKRVLQRMVATQHPNHKIDYTNAKVPVIAYKSESLGDGTAPNITSVQGMLIAIY